jgi:predicted dehydrogenase
VNDTLLVACDRPHSLAQKEFMRMSRHTRRDFLEQSLFAAAAASLARVPSTAQAADVEKKVKSPNDKVRMACIGVGGRGSEHIREFGSNHHCELVALVDVDEAHGQQRVESVKKWLGRAPKYYRDLRKMLEDPSIDAVSIATPNHWHSLAAIWAIQAGKQVYLEKPVSHNVSEGRRVVQAARKHGAVVQTGTQCRSNPGMRQAIEFVRSGKIGEVKLARGLCYKRRKSIGPKGTYPVPATVDYNLWLGPAPMKPLTRPHLHYDWHWVWDTGNGDLGNQGIHQMDIARWGLGVDDIGTGVVSYGGRFGYEDAGESANTQVSIHEYPGGKRLVFEVRGLETPKFRDVGVGVIFYGTEGSVVIPSYSGGVAFDPKGKEIATFKGGSDKYHFGNFVEAVLSREPKLLNADILEGHRSSALCHLGNISYRLCETITGEEVSERLATDKEGLETFQRVSEHLAANMVPIEHNRIVRFGKRLAIDPQSETFTSQSASDANSMLTRDYRSPFVVPAEKDV